VPRQRVPAPYPPEFRAEAIRLARSGDRKLSEIADDLGVSQQSLRNWVRQADLDEGRRHDGLTTEDRAELARLRRENRVLREERDILKKAAAFFAKETRSTP
jgi:transposase